MLLVCMIILSGSIEAHFRLKSLHQCLSIYHRRRPFTVCVVSIINCRWCCVEHDLSADSEEINEKSSTSVRRNSSLRTRRLQMSRHEPAKDVNKPHDDTVFYSVYVCNILMCLRTFWYYHNRLSILAFSVWHWYVCFIRHLLLLCCSPSYRWFLLCNTMLVWHMLWSCVCLFVFLSITSRCSVKTANQGRANNVIW